MNYIGAFQTNEINLESKNGSENDLHLMNSLDEIKGYTGIDYSTNDESRG